ncbi:MAG: phosphate acetyl/butaryl transferase [Enterocloster citroniae]|nr:phosphate acetyl/butaryl transferase [Enterocloster citroniae]
MTLIEELIEKAKKTPKRIALPECEAEKTLLAARKVLEAHIGIPVLVNDPAVIQETAQKAGVSLEGMEIIDTADETFRDSVVSRYMHYPKLMLSEKGAKRKMKNPMYYAMILEAVGDVDGTFCGHVNTTGDVLLAAQQTIGMQDGVDVPSIFALTEIPGFHGSEGNRIALADCGLNPEPAADELASIAIASCDNIRALMGWEPRCAFLSFSTCGSGTAASVEKIQEAIKIARNRRPDLKIDGEFQLDAALDPVVAAKKVSYPSEVAGKANILIFPELNAANIGIKMIQLFAGGKGYGHTLSGFAKPVADSSRGATVEEIVGDIAMVIIAAAHL